MTFNQILELIEILPDSDQETLIEIIQKRQAAKKRAALRKEIQQAQAEYEAGEIRTGTVDDLMRELEQ